MKIYRHWEIFQGSSERPLQRVYISAIIGLINKVDWFTGSRKTSGRFIREANPKQGMGEVTKELGRRWADIDPETQEEVQESGGGGLQAIQPGQD